MSNRVVVTGFAACASTGLHIDDIWQSIQAKNSGIKKINDNFPYPWGAELAEHQPRAMLKDRKLLKVISKQDVFGLYASDAAVAHADFISYRDSLDDPTDFNDRTGVFVGSPGNKFQQQYDFLPLIDSPQNELSKFAGELSSTVHPMWLLRVLPNNVLAYTAIGNGFKGANENINNHGVSGVQAILEATYQIQRGAIDRAVVIGYDTAIAEQEMFYYANLGVLSQKQLNAFDQKHDGTILGEGAGALILESEATAKERGATCYAEILGGATRCDAKGIFSIDHKSDNCQALFRQALQQAEVSAEEIGLICAHANGTPLSDATEAQAFAAVFEHQPPVTGFKWSIGHTICAAGVLETILSLKSLREKIAPGLPNLHQVADECAGINASNETQKIESPIALVNSRGFSGVNSCLVMKSWE